jgi:phosphate transport system protein
MVDHHIVTQFDEELDELRATIARMGGLVEQQMANAISAIGRRDDTLARRCQEADVEIDAMEDKVEALTLRMLALRQPVALDLRAILAALRIAHDLERMGDYATNVAKRASALAQLPDVEKAVTAWNRDQEIDQMYTSLFRELLTYMMEDPRNITPCAHLLFVAKNIERIGDHATNIAETVYFQEKGTRLEGLRPKGDRTSYAVVEPPEPDAVT